jgi:hypothetical protein
MRAAASNSLRGLLVAGLIDSFGLALGWTVFTLLAISKGGLAAAGLYNAAMLIGVMLSAPVTGWLASRMRGRTLLTVTGCVEIVLRAAPIVVVCIVVMNVAAWAGYAGMRAEVAAADPGPHAMTRYAMTIAAIEAFGAGVAAALPIGSPGTINGGLLVAVVAVYGASLLPTFGCARRSQVPSTRSVRQPNPGRLDSVNPDSVSRDAVPTTPGMTLPPARQKDPSAPALRTRAGPLLAGALIMLVASGPTRLAVALAAQLYGHFAVVIATAAFSGGCLFSSLAVRRVARLRLPVTLIWPLWGIGMVIGWIVAPWHIVGLLVAQFLAGLSLTAFEGAMDARAAVNAGTGRVTAVLAWSAASRALGSAAAVRILPLLVAAPEIGQLSTSLAGALIVAGGIAWAAVKLQSLAWQGPSTRHHIDPPASNVPRAENLAELSTAAEA